MSSQPQDRRVSTCSLLAGIITAMVIPIVRTRKRKLERFIFPQPHNHHQYRGSLTPEGTELFIPGGDINEDINEVVMNCCRCDYLSPL